MDNALHSYFYKTLIVALLLLGGFSTSAQNLFYNNGARFYVNPGAVMIVKTNSIHNASGRIDNGGTIIVEEDILNNDLITGNNTSGTFDLYGDWINNADFTADQTDVNLLGADQMITGAAVSAYYNLSLQGTGIKQQTVDAEVQNILALNDRELATGDHIMQVTNTDPAAITRTTGFVSSTNSGALVRSTDQSTAYLFPTGSSTGTPRYRPVELTPEANSANAYGVRFANTDATSEGYDRENKEEVLCTINPEWYHRITQPNGNSSADLSIFYDAADGDWQTVAHWQNSPQWEDIGPATDNGNSMTVSGWNDFSLPAFALANPAPSVSLGNDTLVKAGEPVTLSSTISGTNLNYSWTPDDYLDCSDCPEPVAAPEESLVYMLEVDNGTACLARDSVFIEVFENTAIIMPTAFSPNGDGFNDVFRPRGATDKLVDITFQVFNRWGEKVFEATDINTALLGWDGTYKDEPMGIQTFTFYVKARLSNTPEEVELTGNVTIVK